MRPPRSRRPAPCRPRRTRPPGCSPRPRRPPRRPAPRPRARPGGRSEEARTRVLAELHDLEATRDQLRADVDLLDRHLEAQRDRVRRTTHELQPMLDDPDSLRPISLPEPTPPHGGAGRCATGGRRGGGADRARSPRRTRVRSPRPRTAAETDQPSPDASGVAPRGDADEQRPLAPAAWCCRRGGRRPSPLGAPTTARPPSPSTSWPNAGSARTTPTWPSSARP